MEDQDVRFRRAGEECLIVEFHQEISEQINRRVMELAKNLRNRPVLGIVDMIPAYCTLLINYNPLTVSREALISDIKKRLSLPEGKEETVGRVVEIPVCYGRYFGPDLRSVADYAGLSPKEVIRIHSGRDYRIYMMGFLPGFPYLGGLDQRIASPRLAVPRTKIPAGSVGIGGAQTGIYPLASPGGWQLIGRTPLAVYDPLREEPFLYRAGDSIRFIPIDPEEYYDLRRQSMKGTQER